MAQYSRWVGILVLLESWGRFARPTRTDAQTHKQAHAHIPHVTIYTLISRHAHSHSFSLKLFSSKAIELLILPSSWIYPSPLPSSSQSLVIAGKSSVHFSRTVIPSSI